ncbi:hypothetical protein [Streptomyces bambusae]|uniref:hypothetical protein n=1 Tax=Streptomyces bambusae TaxID=1550616 RepID=UPI0035AC01DD
MGAGHEPAARAAWAPAIESGQIKMLDNLFAVVRCPANAWSWVDTAQYKLTQKSQHRGAGPLDLLACATAVHHRLTVLHRDADFPAVARVLADVDELDIRSFPPPA